MAQNHVYQSEGGQLTVTATATLSDGGTVEDCTKAYVEGPAGGIYPNSIITNQLAGTGQSYPNSYPNSAYYPNTYYPKDGTATPDLAAQIAAHESSYTQFQTPALCNGHPDLWGLDATYGILAKWPEEPYVYDENNVCTGTDGGSHIGLMQVMTDADQSSDPNAWNWVTDTGDGVGLFSGTPPTEYNDTKSKMQHAIDYMNEIIQEYVPGPLPSGQLPPLSGFQLENQALVLYGPGAPHGAAHDEFCIPACSSGVSQYDSLTNNYICVGGTWAWSENSQGSPAVQYVDEVRQESAASCQ